MRAEGVWRFRRRALEFHQVVPLDELAAAMASERRVRRGGEAEDADYPECFTTWQRWHASE